MLGHHASMWLGAPYELGASWSALEQMAGRLEVLATEAVSMEN